MGGGTLLFLIVLAAGPFLTGLERTAGGGAVLEILPGPAQGGEALGRRFFRFLEEEALEWKPGPVRVEVILEGASYSLVMEALDGLEAVLRSRGFEPFFSRREGRGARALRFHARMLEGGKLLFSLSGPGRGVPPLRVQVHPISWMGGDVPPPGTLRLSGEWEGSPGEALASARKAARHRIEAFLARSLPWRPWKRFFLERLPRGGKEKGAFLQMTTTRDGKVWRGWVLWEDGGKTLKWAERLLAEEDMRWLLRLGLAAAAALATWLAAARLDWATRGFFTIRIKALAFLAWLGACGAFWLVV